jgi:hypothetical protein
MADGRGEHSNVISTRMPFVLGLALASLNAVPSFADSAKGQVVDQELQSKNFAQNKIGVSPVRKMAVYLPAGYYEASRTDPGKRYPVIYFFPDPSGGYFRPDPAGSYRAPFAKQGAQALFDRAIAAGMIGEFILVSVDMNTPLGSSWYVNSPVTGNWEDFMIHELVPYMDANFKTLANRDSRGIAGDFMGGYGAIRFGMRHPDVFGSVYALGPMGTGSGLQVMYSRPNWDLLVNAKSLDDVKKEGFWPDIFTTIFQAHLPNPDKPSLFIGLYAHKVGDQFVVDSKIAERLHSNFLLERMIPRCADNLKSLRGFKLDWERNDGNPDHVYANQACTRKLDEFGIPHEAEKYSSVWGHGVWGDDGRVYTEVLPFFQRHLVFDKN